jgi:inner membrane protein
MGLMTVGAYLVADVLTPMGIWPFVPVDDREYSLSVTAASNTLANYTLLALGIAAATLAVGRALRGLISSCSGICREVLHPQIASIGWAVLQIRNGSQGRRDRSGLGC